MRCISVKIKVISARQKNVFHSLSFLKMKKYLLDMRKVFFTMTNFYLVEILSEQTVLLHWQLKKYSKWAIVCFFSHNENQKFAVIACLDAPLSCPLCQYQLGASDREEGGSVATVGISLWVYNCRCVCIGVCRWAWEEEEPYVCAEWTRWLRMLLDLV